MPLINLREIEIQLLNYERYYYPCPIVQKRIHAVYLKETSAMSNAMIGSLVGLNRDSVGDWISRYRQDGFEALCQFNYGTNKSVLETHSTSILQSFTEQPPMSVNEAKSRIEEQTGISRSPSQVRNFMKRHGLRYLQTGHIPPKADTAKQQQWVKEKLDPAIKEAQNGECQLLFMDAAHFILLMFRGVNPHIRDFHSLAAFHFVKRTIFTIQGTHSTLPKAGRTWLQKLFGN